jgi:hypothetical protein
MSDDIQINEAGLEAIATFVFPDDAVSGSHYEAHLEQLGRVLERKGHPCSRAQALRHAVEDGLVWEERRKKEDQVKTFTDVALGLFCFACCWR